jgi:hypothetical protein
MRVRALTDLVIDGRRVSEGCSINVDASTALRLMFAGQAEPDDRRTAQELGARPGSVRFRTASAARPRR